MTVKKTGNLAQKNAFKYEDYSHGIDYLTYGISKQDIIDHFFTERIYNLDTDNSNYGVVKFQGELLSIQKWKGTTGDCYGFSCNYHTVPIPIFTITQFSKNQSELCNNQWGVIHFYGAYFRLIELGHFEDQFIEMINTIFYNSPISRLDYRFDYMTKEYIKSVPPIKKVLPYIRKNKKVKTYQNGDGKLQSWEVGNKKNKTIFIRLYNKLDELENNIKKTYLYGDLEKYKTFFRLEYEFGIKYTAGYTGKDIDKLIQKAFATSGLNESSFSGNLYKPTFALNLNDQIQRLRYIKIFKSMAKNIKTNGLDLNVILKDII